MGKARIVLALAGRFLRPEAFSDPTFKKSLINSKGKLRFDRFLLGEDWYLEDWRAVQFGGWYGVVRCGCWSIGRCGRFLGMSETTGWMMECLELARGAMLRDEVPIGALVVRDGVVIGRGSNTRELARSVTGHAEIQAIEEASRVLGSWRLTGCTLVTTLEPCVMCAGAIVQARVEKLVYGARDPKGGGHTLFSILDSEKLNHRVEVVSGVLENECGEILRAFFKKKRDKKNEEAPLADVRV